MAPPGAIKVIAAEKPKVEAPKFKDKLLLQVHKLIEKPLTHNGSERCAS